MRIGVVCEGPTDYFAIHSFLGRSLAASGLQAEFVPVQPELDNTQPKAGWGNVLLWLQKNPPAVRVQKLFGGGIFGGSLATQPIDCLLIQMDSDILGENSFCTHVKNKYGYTVLNPTPPRARASEIHNVLCRAADFSAMTLADINRHVLAPAVESTETWCAASFITPTVNFEILSGQDLIDAFMSALARFESQIPIPPYSNVDKNMKRRKRFCEAQAGSFERVVRGCEQFAKIHNEVIAKS